MLQGKNKKPIKLKKKKKEKKVRSTNKYFTWGWEGSRKVKGKEEEMVWQIGSLCSLHPHIKKVLFREREREREREKRKEVDDEDEEEEGPVVLCYVIM